MSLTFGFYNSLNGDRKYNAEQVSSLFDGLIQDGVFASIGDALMVKPGIGMQVLVGTGRAWFNHTWTLNDAQLPLNIDGSDLVLKRIDAVVLEVDTTTAKRANSIKIVKGVSNSNPSKPAMTNTDGVYQHALAYVTIEAGSSSITGTNIENVIGKDKQTPFVTSICESVSITDLFSQWNGQFTEWFDNVKAQLSGNVVSNLQRQIDEKVAKADKATEEEALAGTNNERWMTPALVKATSQYAYIGDDKYKIVQNPMLFARDYTSSLNKFPIYRGSDWTYDNSSATTSVTLSSNGYTYTIDRSKTYIKDALLSSSNNIIASTIYDPRNSKLYSMAYIYSRDPNNLAFRYLVIDDLKTHKTTLTNSYIVGAGSSSTNIAFNLRYNTLCDYNNEIIAFGISTEDNKYTQADYNIDLNWLLFDTKYQKGYADDYFKTHNNKIVNQNCRGNNFYIFCTENWWGYASYTSLYMSKRGKDVNIYSYDFHDNLYLDSSSSVHIVPIYATNTSFYVVIATNTDLIISKFTESNDTLIRTNSATIRSSDCISGSKFVVNSNYGLVAFEKDKLVYVALYNDSNQFYDTSLVISLDSLIPTSKLPLANAKIIDGNSPHNYWTTDEYASVAMPMAKKVFIDDRYLIIGSNIYFDFEQGKFIYDKFKDFDSLKNSEFCINEYYTPFTTPSNGYVPEWTTMPVQNYFIKSKIFKDSIMCVNYFPMDNLYIKYMINAKGCVTHNFGIRYTNSNVPSGSNIHDRDIYLKAMIPGIITDDGFVDDDTPCVLVSKSLYSPYPYQALSLRDLAISIGISLD